MIREHKHEIEEMMGELQCPEDFQHHKPGFDVLCKARDVGLETFVECLEENADKCAFLLSLTGVHYCKCPLCVHIIRNRKELQGVIGHLSCPKDFQCYKSGFEVLCKARDVGLETFVECLEENAYECPFLLPLDGVHYCKCSLRVYIAKKLNM